MYYKNHNIGGLLQAFALQKTLENIGVTAEQICYNYHIYGEGKSFQNRRNKISQEYADNGFWQGSIFIAKSAVKKIFLETIGRKEKLKIAARIQKYDSFADHIPHSSKIYTSEDIIKTIDKYDIFICGGDQIWNDWSGIDLNSSWVFTLQFVGNNKRKFSYSASTGKANLSEELLKKLETGVSNLDMISVREKSSVKSVKKMTDKEVYVVPDPVLLLREKQWNEFCDKTGNQDNEISEPYIFSYFLDYDSQIRKAVKKFAHRVGLKVLWMPYVHNGFNLRDLFGGDIRDFNSGPAEFVNLIRNARIVITDSFHASAFSMIFHKPFYVFERACIVGEATMNVRINDFLNEYGLEGRMISRNELNNQNSIESVDYTYADEMLEKNIQEGMSFLQSALEASV